MGPVRRAFLDHPSPIAFAHRGGAGSGPENTMSAFAHAVALGYTYVETDVHVTSDGVLVAFHDELLDRVTDGTGRIDERPWSYVRSLEVRPAGVETPSSSAPQRVATLEELLGTWRHLRVNIDPKSEAAVLPLVTTLGRMDALERVCVGSFSSQRLKRFRRLTAGRVCTAMGPTEVARLRLAAAGFPGGRFAADCAQVPRRALGTTLASRQLVDAAHRLGIPVHVWTIDQPSEIERLLDLGVDGIMTDAPEVLKRVLSARGAWG